MSLLGVTFDTKGLEAWAQALSKREIRNAVRRAIDKSARFARKEAIKIIAADIGTAPAQFKDAVPKVKATTQAFLSATWTVSKARIGILNVKRASISKANGLSASTFRLSDGGSKRLEAKHAFVVTLANGGRFVALRKGRARLPIKGVYAEMPNQAMGQPNAPAAKLWHKIASTATNRLLQIELTKAFNGRFQSARTSE
jgi:hypothetical protein